MKSKAYILREIRELLIDNRGYSEDDAKEKADELAPRTVYELLTLKKELATDKEFEDVSISASIRRY
jgi:hypothetical protein|tara:strand:- start:3466 stop:3666 length:201 start_codon:yes stop_codon:yes gene_type:complete